MTAANYILLAGSLVCGGILTLYAHLTTRRFLRQYRHNTARLTLHAPNALRWQKRRTLKGPVWTLEVCCINPSRNGCDWQPVDLYDLEIIFKKAIKLPPLPGTHDG